eukprot:CAMPEP_0178435086 /NCGR_PEP_ID=MMETSP0689_2-20121128/33749_1 /TAXON_ID=160604 /ORGANISM="Amphidinium massartii, Strain CS-259" /LENGTH=171 /DNA_ID=CAMNT_0020057153 /DNA_START=46 /DNA_END=560 /DNA_ORIENTATION=+
MTLRSWCAGGANQEELEGTCPLAEPEAASDTNAVNQTWLRGSIRMFLQQHQLCLDLCFGLSLRHWGWGFRCDPHQSVQWHRVLQRVHVSPLWQLIGHAAPLSCRSVHRRWLHRHPRSGSEQEISSDPDLEEPVDISKVLGIEISWASPPWMQLLECSTERRCGYAPLGLPR